MLGLAPSPPCLSRATWCAPAHCSRRTSAPYITLRPFAPPRPGHSRRQFPSTKDKEWPDRFPGKSTAHIIAPAEHPWFDNWAGTTIKSRGDAYVAERPRPAFAPDPDPVYRLFPLFFWPSSESRHRVSHAHPSALWVACLARPTHPASSHRLPPPPDALPVPSTSSISGTSR